LKILIYYLVKSVGQIDLKGNKFMWSEVRNLIEEVDYGTPPREGTLVNLTIDGVNVSVPEKSSIMYAAAAAGKPIPKLCATDTLEAFGSCRVCLVEIEGKYGYPASCTTPVAEGLVVRTTTEKLDQIRRGVLELYLSDFPPGEIADGWSEFHETLKKEGVSRHRYGQGKNHFDELLDTSNPYFLFDPSKCIVCSRCVRACSEIQGTFALSIAGRGFDSVVNAGQDENFLESECVSCGACVQACPSHALVEKSLFEGEYKHV
jgi:formate dehydrogenase major subunit